MKTISKTLYSALLGFLLAAGMTTTVVAQYGTYDNQTNQNLVRDIQVRTDTLTRRLQNASDRGNLSGYQVTQLNRLISDFRTANTQLDRRLSNRRATASDVSLVLDRARPIDDFFVNNRVGAGVQRDWQALQSDLDQLARAYNINWQWNSTGSTGTDYGSYNLNDAQMRQLVQRIDTRSTAFSRTLRMDLNRQYSSDRYSIDQVRQQLSTFESGVVTLRNRVNSRQSTQSDARNLLDASSFLNSYLANNQLSAQTERNWTFLRDQLDQLAGAYNIAWNWSTVPNGNGYPTNADLTGTYRLNTSQGDDARNSVEAATRNLSTAERQRVYDSLLRRLDPPQMIAIDRRGTTVTIASTRAPQVNFVADGREQVETTQNGRTIRVRAQISGDVLSISRTGDRAEDFTVTFDSTNSGRQLLVTRSIYSDRLTQPVIVKTYYDRVSDVAQLNLYDTNREDSIGDTTTTASGTFVIPNGVQLVGVLNNDLSTQNARENERFTLTVRSPGEYEGATIEGSVTSVNRGGRITGRSEMTLDFDTIRLRDGRSYRFAGILESVRMPNGDVVKVDNEGAVRDSDQTNKTVTRTAIGTAVGAIIGAIAGGGKGAAIGAVIGAGAGAGSVYVQGRNDLDLGAGTEITVRSTGPRNN